MKISKNDKVLLFEQEFLTLIIVCLLSVAFHFWINSIGFYLLTILVGFILYFWMLYEEKIHLTGMKHTYFEHTSSFLMVAQTALALQFVSRGFDWQLFVVLFMVVSVIMYSLSLARIILFKFVFRQEHKKA
jgi:hypothetical protein